MTPPGNGPGEALLLLWERTSGPVKTENHGFAPDDEAIGAALARAYALHGELTGPQAAVARSIIARHSGQLTHLPVGAPELLSPVPDVSKPKPTPSFERRSADVSFKVINGKIQARTPFALKDVVKAIPGRKWNPNDKVWEWVAGPVAAQLLAETLAEYKPTWDEEFEALVGVVAAAQVHKTAEAADLPPIPHINPNTVPWLHQRRAYHFIKAMGPAAALWLEQGVGKSLPAVARALEIGGDILIACPSKVVGVWPREFRRHGDQPVHIENGQRPKARGRGMKSLSMVDRLEKFKELRSCDCGKTHVYVVNYEVAAREPLKTWLKGQNWDMLVCDESHRTKGPQGEISKTLHKVGLKSRNRLELSGTPMPHSPLDLFAQYRILDPAIFGTAFTPHKNKYALWGGYEDRNYLGMNPENMEEFWTKAYSLSFRVLADDVLDLPAVVPDTVLSCTLEGAQAKAYNDMEKKLMASFPGMSRQQVVEAMVAGEITSPNVMVKGTYLRQITGGGLRDERTNQVLEVGETKGKLLAEWMADFPDGKGIGIDGKPQRSEPIVVFCQFTHDLGVVRRVVEAQGRIYGEISGKQNDLSADGEFPEHIDVMGVQIQAGGSGVDLTRSAYACYYSVGYSLGDYLQSRARLRRPGQTRSVRFTHLVAEGTIDEDVYAALAMRAEDIRPLDDRR